MISSTPVEIIKAMNIWLTDSVGSVITIVTKKSVAEKRNQLKVLVARMVVLVKWAELYTSGANSMMTFAAISTKTIATASTSTFAAISTKTIAPACICRTPWYNKTT